MNETTTTDDQLDQAASGQDPQLDTSAGAPAEVTEDTQTDPATDSSDATGADDDVEWLRNKGIDPSDATTALKAAAKLARDTERQFHETRQAAKGDLQNAAKEAVTENPSADEATQVLNEVVMHQRVTDFYLRNPDALAHDEKIGALIREKPYLLQDFDTAWRLVKADLSDADLATARSQAKQEAKQEIARQGANAKPRGNANGASLGKTEAQAQLERFSNWD